METLERYGHGTPDDWLERNVYDKHSRKGVALMLIINIILFGPMGLDDLGDTDGMGADHGCRYHQRRWPLLGLSQFPGGRCQP